MSTASGKPLESAGEFTENSPVTIPSGTIYSYNLDGRKPPAGSKSGGKCG